MKTNHPRQDEQDNSNLDIDAIVAKRGQIAIIWSIEDVQAVRPRLTAEQAWEVLEEVKRKHDAVWGVCWMTLEIWADKLFPDTAQLDDGEAQP